MTPSVSVIIAVYGRFNLLKHAVESILAQTYPVSEIILIDDGSIDETPQELPRYIAEKPAWRERVRYFYQENQGQSVAINNGIARAKGEWLAFNGDDDLWLPWKLEWQFRALEKYKDQCGLCFTDAWFMNNPYEKTTLFQLGGNLGHELLGMISKPARLMTHHREWVWCQTVLARADLVRSLAGFDPLLRYAEDIDFIFRAALVSDFCYVGIPMVLIDRSPSELKHVGEAKNWRRADFTLRMEQYHFEKQLSLAGELEPDIRRSIRRNLRDIHSQWASLYVGNGEFRKARKSLSTAIRYCPGLKVALKWALTRLTPEVARKIIMVRRLRATRRDDTSSWQAERKKPLETENGSLLTGRGAMG
jgi:glycosyltransferase involved in cell wall biosynthesis